MGITERKERQRAELREQILTAARRIVLDEGFDGLTMRKIADAIEYSPATIYLYFESREAIGQQLCAEAFEHLVSYMGPAAATPDPADRLKAIGRSYARFGLENPKEYKLLFMTDVAFMEALFADAGKGPDDPGERAFQFVVDAVIACRDCGIIAAEDPEMVAELLWTSVHGVVSLALTCHRALATPVEQLVDAMCDVIDLGLRSSPPRARSTS